MTAPSEVQAAAQAELAKRDFREFLSYVKIESDDPDNRGQLDWVPWPHLMERAESWQSGTDEVILKARQLGFSWLLAAFSHWTAAYHPSAHVGVFSKGQFEARKQLRRCRYIWDRLPDALRIPGRWTVDEVEFDNSSMMMALPSTEDAGISLTFALIGADESAFHPYAAQNYAAYQPTLSAGGQYISLSTADPSLGPAGHFHDQYWSSKAGLTPYEAVFIPWDSRPGRDEVWLTRQRRAFEGLPEAFDAYYPETDAAAFVARTGLVYPMFSDDRHICDAPCDWKDYKRRYAGVDFGGGDPTAIVLLGVTSSGHIHQHAEFYERGPVTVEQIGTFLNKWHGQGHIHRIECDPSEGTAIASLHASGLQAYPADNRREGIGTVATLLEQMGADGKTPRLTIDPSCKGSIAEFPTYRWSERVDPHSKDRYKTSTPVDNHGDGMDARRYAVAKLISDEHSRQNAIGPTLRGKRRARQAV